MSEITAPAICPECSSPVVEFTEEKSNIVTHWCENVECPGRIADMLTFIADRTILEVEGLGPEMAQALATGGYVITLGDLFRFANDARQMLDRVGPDAFKEKVQRKGLPGAATIKMVETLERAKTASWDRWIAALGIPMIGLSMAKTLARELALGSEDFTNLPYKLSAGEMEKRQIEGLGFHKRAELAHHAQSTRFGLLCTSLHLSGARPKAIETVAVAEDAPLKHMTFCITGEFYDIGSRDFLTQQLVKLGATAKSGVSKKVTHLLVGAEAGKTKLVKAAELKINQVEEPELKALLSQHGVKTDALDSMAEWAD